MPYCLVTLIHHSFHHQLCWRQCCLQCHFTPVASEGPHSPPRGVTPPQYIFALFPLPSDKQKTFPKWIQSAYILQSPVKAKLWGMSPRRRKSKLPFNIVCMGKCKSSSHNPELIYRQKEVHPFWTDTEVKVEVILCGLARFIQKMNFTGKLNTGLPRPAAMPEEEDVLSSTLIS